jgi:hypothetical protein
MPPFAFPGTSRKKEGRALLRLISLDDYTTERFLEMPISVIYKLLKNKI